MTDPAERLVELAEREHRLVAEQRFTELEALHAERDGVLDLLPSALAPHQRLLLGRAQAILHAATALAAEARDDLGAELARLDVGRTTVRGYAPAGLAAGPSFDRVG